MELLSLEANGEELPETCFANLMNKEKDDDDETKGDDWAQTHHEKGEYLEMKASKSHTSKIMVGLFTASFLLSAASISFSVLLGMKVSHLKNNAGIETENLQLLRRDWKEIAILASNFKMELKNFTRNFTNFSENNLQQIGREMKNLTLMEDDLKDHLEEIDAKVTNVSAGSNNNLEQCLASVTEVKTDLKNLVKTATENFTHISEINFLMERELENISKVDFGLRMQLENINTKFTSLSEEKNLSLEPTLENFSERDAEVRNQMNEIGRNFTQISENYQQLQNSLEFLNKLDSDKSVELKNIRNNFTILSESNSELGLKVENSTIFEEKVKARFSNVEATLKRSSEENNFKLEQCLGNLTEVELDLENLPEVFNKNLTQLSVSHQQMLLDLKNLSRTDADFNIQLRTFDKKFTSLSEGSNLKMNETLENLTKIDIDFQYHLTELRQNFTTFKESNIQLKQEFEALYKEDIGIKEELKDIQNNLTNIFENNLQLRKELKNTTKGEVDVQEQLTNIEIQFTDNSESLEEIRQGLGNLSRAHNYLKKQLAYVDEKFTSLSAERNLKMKEGLENLTHTEANLTMQLNELKENFINRADCPSIKYHFPRNNQIEDYARYRSYVPRMKEGTICMWLETRDYEAKLTGVVSYATIGNDNGNQRLVYLQHGQVALFVTNNVKTNYGNFDIALFQQKVHICVWFSKKTQESVLYLNGEYSTTRNHEVNVMVGGGDLILAQDQDSPNAGGFSPSQAFTGNITNPMIWPRVLSTDEIRNIATSCKCPQDYAVSMTVDKTEVYGEAYYSIPEECPVL